MSATGIERAQLAECEAIIERGLRTFVEVGNALLTIRRCGLYRDSHGTFEQYCQDRWGFTATRARQLIGAAETATIVAVGGGPAPDTESQARELAGLTPTQAAIVMRVAHTATGGKITAAAIRVARAQPWTEAEITTAIDGYRIHQFIAVFPAFAPDEWAGLIASVERSGLFQRIFLSADGTTILDGRFRYLALRWLGFDPETATTSSSHPVLQRQPDCDNDETTCAVIYAVNCLRDNSRTREGYEAHFAEADRQVTQ